VRLGQLALGQRRADVAGHRGPDLVRKLRLHGLHVYPTIQRGSSASGRESRARRLFQGGELGEPCVVRPDRPADPEMTCETRALAHAAEQATACEDILVEAAL